MAVRLSEAVACKNKLCKYEGRIDRYEGDGRCLPYELSDSEAVCPECGFKTLGKVWEGAAFQRAIKGENNG